MKKALVCILSVLMALSVFGTATFAIDDAPGLNYGISLKVYDTAGNPAVSFDSGDTFKVDVLFESKGENQAPIYVVQGKLSYSGNCIIPDNIDCSDYVETSMEQNVISFNIFDKTLNGLNIGTSKRLMTITFRAVTSGSSDIGFDTLAVTNSDATLRQADYSSQETVVIGGGNREINKAELMNIIKLCEDEAAKIIISDDASTVHSSAYFIPQSKYDRLQDAIKAAYLVYNSETVGTDDLKTAIETLDNELGLFKANKEKGVIKNSSIRSDTILSNLTVTATAEEHGKIDSKYVTQKTAKNTSVTIIAVPDEGYTVDKVYVNGEEFEGSEIFTIEKVTNDTVARFTFKWKNIFADVKNDDWFYDSVMAVHKNGLMKGISENAFSPNTAVTRGMFVTVLHRMENQPEAAPIKFSDVSSGQYYEKAIAWANEKGVVNGKSDYIFAPDEEITREQMAAIIFRYLTIIKGESLNNSGSTEYADNDTISQYAHDAVAFCSKKSIMNGKGDGVFAPLDNATRAETAAVLQRIIK